MKYTGSADVKKLIYKGHFGLDEDDFLEVTDYLENLRDIMNDIHSIAKYDCEDDIARAIACKAEACNTYLSEALYSLSDISIRDLTDELDDLKRAHTIKKD